MGQCGSYKATTCDAHQLQNAVQLDRVRMRSSNAAVVSSRYHGIPDGAPTARRLVDDYEVQEKVLGHGLCGDVVLAKSRVDGRKCALKTIPKQKVPSGKMEAFYAEVEIYLALDHPNIARLRDVYESPTEIYMLIECCDGGELYYRVQRRGVYTDADAAQCTREMLRAVSYLHSQGVVHRDLKLENFLYDTEEKDAVLKLIDFGFAKIWDPATVMMASCGSVAYVSPDVLSGKGYTNKCDMWSLGVIVWMLLVGYPPFHGEDSVMRQLIAKGEPDWHHKTRWNRVKEDAKDFVKRLLTVDPKLRYSAQEAMMHRWLKNKDAADKRLELDTEILRRLQRYADTSKVRRAALQLLAQELTSEETRELREAFLRIDKGNEGTISLKDLKEAIRGTNDRRRSTLSTSPMSPSSGGSGTPSGSNSPTPCTPARRLQRADSGELKELFSVLDSNGDERISYLDFLAATTQVRSLLRKEAVRAVFNRLDRDRSGTISVSDFRVAIGETFEGVDVEELVHEVKSSGKDGITFDAFVRVLEEQDAVPTPKGRPPQLLPESPFGALSPAIPERQELEI